MKSLYIREEKSVDFKQINNVVTKAFKDDGADVAKLVELIRISENYMPRFSLVAEINEKIVGHIMLSAVQLINNEETHRALTLSPLAVHPSYQNQKIGSQLVRSAIEIADNAGEQLIVLEGDPKYYSRFGFEFSELYDVYINLPDWAPKEAAQIYKLTNFEPNLKGKVLYPIAFDHVIH